RNVKDSIERVRVQNVGSLHIAAIRDQATHLDLSEKILRHVGTLLDYFKKTATKFGRCVVVYPCDGAESPSFTIEVGWEVDVPFRGDGGTIVPVLTPAGMVATATHIGAYDRMHEANHAIREWCARTHHRLAGPSWEIYDHPREGQPPRTDVFYLLA